MSSGHPHLLESEAGKILCACDACALLLSGRQGRHKRIPRRVERLTDFQMTDGEWDAMLIPIGMAFFFEKSRSKRIVALYPGPGGATESLLGLDAWQDLASRNPRLATMEPDVEALLVNRLGASRGFPTPEYYILPIDECYRLVGLIRSQWHGFSGGTEVWETLRLFFKNLQDRAAVPANHVYA